MVGEDVTLRCSITDAGLDGSLQTWRRPSGDAITENGNMLGSFDGKYTIEGTYNLVIVSAQIEDAGKYTCESTFAVGGVAKSSLQLIMLGKDSLYYLPNLEHYFPLKS